MRGLVFGFTLIAVVLVSPPVSADTVFPARLEIKEAEPALFDVRFTLPIVNNRKARAEPILPQVCTPVGDPRISWVYSEYSEYRVVRCPPDSLFGKVIAVKGLLGTQIDVILFLEFLDGRKFTATLKPARPAFLIPSPPSLIKLAGTEAFRAMQEVVRKPEVFILAITILLFGVSIRRAKEIGFGFLLGYAAGHILLLERLVQLPQPFWVLLALGVALVPLSGLLKKEPDPILRLAPLWLTAGLLGLTFGASGAAASTNETFATVEQYTAFVAQVAGVGGAIALIGLLTIELRTLVKSALQPASFERAQLIIARALTITTFALVYLQLSGLLLGSSIFPAAPLELYLAALAIGLWLGLSQSPIRINSGVLLCTSLVAGIMLGHAGLPLPFGTLAGSVSLFVLGVSLFFETMGKPALVLWLASAALFLQGWSSSEYIRQNISLPVAVSVGACLAVVLIAYWSRMISRSPAPRATLTFRVIGLLVAGTALWIRAGEYLEWSTDVVSGAVAIGLLPLPLLSLGLLITAIAVWPRRQRIRKLLDVKPRKQVLHWVFLVGAFFALPIVTINVPNLLHTPAAPSGEAARHILKNTLSATYYAFNLDSEDELYDRLSESVTENLIADVYLDSRRKLTSGVRQGAEVTVREVDVLRLDDAVTGTNPFDGYEYQCTWAVTARVSHLQHVHHRRNIYSGTLLIRLSDDRWKIDRIDLMSEDRAVVSWRAG
jgi:hypothetical protein